MGAAPLQDRPLAARAGGLALQVLGLAGSSHLLEQIARAVAGFDSIGLAERLVPDASGEPAAVVFDLGDPFFQTLAVTALGSAVVEELVFRGLLFAVFLRLWGRGWAVGLSAVLFGVAHLDWTHSVVAALLGVQLGALRQLHGLTVAVFAHLLNNALWVAVVALGPDSSIGALMPSPASLLVAAVLSGSACAALVQAWRTSAAP